MPSFPSLLRSLRLAVALLASATTLSGYAQERAIKGAEDPMNPCGVIYSGTYGPYDYRTDQDKLKIVEDFHFTPQVETLRAGQSTYIGGDLNYTLHAFPNHHRALIAMVRLTEREKSTKPEGVRYPVECYFDRALRFAPDDTKVRAIYAQFLHKNNRRTEAMGQLESATEYADQTAVAHYNIGLVYYQMREYEKALAQAHKAMGLGLADPQLEKLLKRAGYWKDPPKR